MNIKELANSSSMEGKADELAKALNDMLDANSDKLELITSENKHGKETKVFQICDHEVYSLYMDKICSTEIHEYVRKITRDKYSFIVEDFSLSISKQERLTIRVFC